MALPASEPVEVAPDLLDRMPGGLVRRRLQRAGAFVLNHQPVEDGVRPARCKGVLRVGQGIDPDLAAEAVEEGINSAAEVGLIWAVGENFLQFPAQGV
jgi:hypothetical protein